MTRHVNEPPAVTASLSIPRHRGFIVALVIIRATVSAYVHRVPSVTFEMRGGS